MMRFFNFLFLAFPVSPTYGFDVVAQAVTTPTDHPPQQPAQFSYIERGAKITLPYEHYTTQLAAFKGQLRNHLAAEAPDLLPQLTKESPHPKLYGYQLVPKLVPSKPPARVPPRITSTS